MTALLSFRDPKFLPFFKQTISHEFYISEKPDFQIQINKFGFKQLDLMASESLKRGFLKDESRKWVPCRVIKNGVATECKIRLRGDLPKHWGGIKRSYRIKFKETSPLWGWKKVDLILPEDKGYEAELVAYKLAKRLNLISPGAKFSNVIINGVNAGTYLIKQGDSGSLYEMNGRTESMVIKENNIWWYADNAGGIYKSPYGKNRWDSTNLSSLPILYAPTFHGKAATDLTYSRFAKFLKLTSEEKNIDNYLDQKNFYSWLAIALSFGSFHSTLPDNLLWYVSGSTGLAEPIIYDVLSFKLVGNPFIFFSQKSFMVRKILKLTWSHGGKEHFAQAMKVISENIDPDYDLSIKERDEVKSRTDSYSLEEAAKRKSDVKENIKLIETYLSQTSF